MKFQKVGKINTPSVKRPYFLKNMKQIMEKMSFDVKF